MEVPAVRLGTREERKCGQKKGSGFLGVYRERIPWRGRLEVVLSGRKKSGSGPARTVFRIEIPQARLNSRVVSQDVLGGGLPKMARGIIHKGTGDLSFFSTVSRCVGTSNMKPVSIFEGGGAHI